MLSMNDGMYSHSTISSILISEPTKKSHFRISSLSGVGPDIAHSSFQRVSKMDSTDPMIEKRIGENSIKLVQKTLEYLNHSIITL